MVVLWSESDPIPTFGSWDHQSIQNLSIFIKTTLNDTSYWSKPKVALNDFSNTWSIQYKPHYNIYRSHYIKDCNLHLWGQIHNQGSPTIFDSSPSLFVGRLSLYSSRTLGLSTFPFGFLFNIFPLNGLFISIIYSRVLNIFSHSIFWISMAGL